MSIQSVNQCLDGWFVQMTNVAGGLSGFLSEHHELRVDEAEAIDDYFALDGLDGVDN